MTGPKRAKCYSQILETAFDLDVRAIVIAWDTGRTSLKGEKAVEKCLHFLFERIEVHLTTRKSNGIIVADRPGGGKKQEDKLLANFLERTQKGTEYVVPKNIVLNILTTPSHLVIPLQVADLITGITTAMIAGKYKFAKPHFSLIRKMLIKNSSGTCGGTGLKIFPNNLINLYYWVLGGDMYWRTGMRTGISLPITSYPYASDEFK